MALSQAPFTLFKDTATRAVKGAAAYQKVVSRFTRERMLHEIPSFSQHLLERGSALPSSMKRHEQLCLLRIGILRFFDLCLWIGVLPGLLTGKEDDR